MYLSWADYGVLIILLCISISIGLYQGCIRSKQLSAGEFHIADGRMGVLPTAMSLLASVMSAATLLGIPSETYQYGTMYLYCIFTLWIAIYLNAYLFIPKFRQIGSASIYAYLEQRFSLSVRIAVTCTFIFVNILYMAVVLYGPSLALNQVTGLNMWLAVGLCGFVSTLYTSIGGIRAVIWTDVIQTIMMFIGVILTIIFGFIDAGGVSKVFETIINGDRWQLSIVTLDPTVRYTVWNMIFSNTLYNTALFACLQTQAQRYLCVHSTKSAQKTAWINYGMCVMMVILCECAGCLIYAKYHRCDPLRAKLVSKPDQLYPLFVMETLGRIPGLTGLFIACILSASLSTFSSGVNSIATVVFEDIYKRISNKHSVSDRQQAMVSKFLSGSTGLFIIFLAYLVSFMNSNLIVIIFQLIGSFVAPILGLYILGFFAPRVNHRNALVTFILCLILQTLMLIFGNFTGKQRRPGGLLPTSVAGCSPLLNDQSEKNRMDLILSLVTTRGTEFCQCLLCGSNDPRTVDASLLSSFKELLPCFHVLRKKTTDATITHEEKDIGLDDHAIEQENML
ncbi:unnamed protein product [Adineta ricciae]|uniref:Sodium-coupled monocarboxylate transporter 1 n=1 Tax=Adineta ricciae TaxID=249248 RepID=A0A814Q394_ADIRI|nr:unnamed protein product [Adineta ricciae]